MPTTNGRPALFRCRWSRAAGSAGHARPGRALLNYGHTLAHALETEGRYDLRHGEAVAVGLVFAARLARRLGRVGDERVAEHDRVVAAYDLPSRLPAGVDTARLVAVMGRDKKATGGGLTFVLDGPEGLEVVPGVGPARSWPPWPNWDRAGPVTGRPYGG